MIDVGVRELGNDRTQFSLKYGETVDWSEHGGVLFVYGASTILASALLVISAFRPLAQYIENALLKAYRAINRLDRTDRSLGFVQGVQVEHLFYWSKRSRREFWIFAFFLPFPIVYSHIHVSLPTCVVLNYCSIV